MLDKCILRVEEFQKFVAARISQNPAYTAVAQELVKIADSLKEGKLIVQIVSRNESSAQALHKIINCDTLAKFYQFKLGNLPSMLQAAKLQSPAVLSEQESVKQAGQLSQYRLSTTQNTLIGRHPECQILLADNLTLVSGFHAEIQPIQNHVSPSNSLNWQICDRSTHGTYINGKRLQGCQSLQPSDRITLAAPLASSSSPEFIFEYQPVSCHNGDRKLADCDILCLVINASQPLTTEEEYLIEQGIQIQLTKIFLVVDTTGSNNQIEQIITTNLTTIKAWVKSQNYKSIELVPLLLESFYPAHQTNTIESSWQEEINNFIHAIEALAKRKPENILLKRITPQILSQITEIERVFDTQEAALKQEVKQQEEKLHSLKRDELKEQAKKLFKKAGEDKDKSFKRVKFEISQSKAALLDEYSEESVFNKIHSFIQQLEPYVIIEGGNKYIQLETQSSSGKRDINATISHFCYSRLNEWATEEWQRIYSFYAEGGLRGIYQRTYTTLNFTSSLNKTNPLFQTSDNINISQIFQKKPVEVESKIYYRPLSTLEYMVKQIRTQTMQWMFILGIPITLVSLLGIGGGKNKIIPSIFAFLLGGVKDKPWLLVLILTIIFYTLFTSLVYALQKENKLKLEEATEKLKEKISNYYQSVAKSLVEKIVQDFSMKLEAEEQRLKEAMETVSEQFTAHITELDKNELAIKLSLEKCKVQQKSLEKEKAELQKFKR